MLSAWTAARWKITTNPGAGLCALAARSTKRAGKSRLAAAAVPPRRSWRRVSGGLSIDVLMRGLLLLKLRTRQGQRQQHRWFGAARRRLFERMARLNAGGLLENRHEQAVHAPPAAVEIGPARRIDARTGDATRRDAIGGIETAQHAADADHVLGDIAPAGRRHRVHP